MKLTLKALVFLVWLMLIISPVMAYCFDYTTPASGSNITWGTTVYNGVPNNELCRFYHVYYFNNYDRDGDGDGYHDCKGSMMYDYILTPSNYNVTTLNYYNSSIECVSIRSTSAGQIAFWPVSAYTNVDARFNGTPTSGQTPLTVQFVSNSTGTAISSYSWNFDVNNVGNVSPSKTNTTQNPVVTFTSVGQYTISLEVHNNESYDIETKSLYINAQGNAPGVMFTCEPVMGSAPLKVNCTDQTTYNPTSELWLFDSSGIGADVLPHSINNTIGHKNVTYPYSGVYSITLNAGNQFGNSSLTRTSYIQVNGTAPEPTPTPAIPFPNSSPVCGLFTPVTQGSLISFPFDTYWGLVQPNGNGMNGLYPNSSGNPNAINTGPLNSQYGIYIYSEYNMSGQLLWHSSYSIINCANTTQTTVPTQIPVTRLTVNPSRTTIVIPTMLPTGVTPTVIPTLTAVPTLTTYPTIPTLSGDDLYNYTVTISPNSKGPVTFMRDLITNMVGFMFLPLTMTLNPMMNTSNGFVVSFEMVEGLLIAFAIYPFLFVYMMGALIAQMPVKVQLMGALVLWTNNIFYLYDRYQGKVIR